MVYFGFIVAAERQPPAAAAPLPLFASAVALVAVVPFKWCEAEHPRRASSVLCKQPVFILICNNPCPQTFVGVQILFRLTIKEQQGSDN